MHVLKHARFIGPYSIADAANYNIIYCRCIAVPRTASFPCTRYYNFIIKKYYLLIIKTQCIDKTRFEQYNLLNNII